MRKTYNGWQLWHKEDFYFDFGIWAGTDFSANGVSKPFQYSPVFSVTVQGDIRA